MLGLARIRERRLELRHLRPHRQLAGGDDLLERGDLLGADVRAR
jgi:hypothetical protein